MVDALVEQPQRAPYPQSLEERLDPAQERSRGAREEQEPECERPEHEETLDPEVRTDVVAPDRQHEADGPERER